MSTDRTKKGLLRRGVCCVSVLAMASLMVVPVASAAPGDETTSDVEWPIPQVEKSIDGYITAGAHRANEPTAEIIGASDTSLNSNSGFTITSGSLSDARTNAKLGVYGSPANYDANPYIWNYYYNFYADTIGLDRTDNVFHLSSGSPAPAGANTNIEDEYGTSADLSWRPDLLIANGGNGTNDYTDTSGNATTYDWGAYSDLILQIRSWTDQEDGKPPSDANQGDYTPLGDGVFQNADGNTVVYSEHYRAGDWNYCPYGVSYSTNNFATLIDSLYGAADAAGKVASADNTKTTRYGDPMDIAYRFEQYASATKWYVLSQIAEIDDVTGKVKTDENGNGIFDRKTVAYVDSFSSSDGTANLTQMTKDGAEVGSPARFVQAAQDTVIDLSTTEWAEEKESTGGRGGTSINYVVEVEGLAHADVIFTRSVDDITAALQEYNESDKGKEAPFTGEVYSRNYPTGTYDLEMNTVEAIMLSGLVQGLIYPDIINPVDMICYYYDEFYHLTPDSMQDALTLNCSNVGLPENMTWTPETYSYDTVQGMLDEGTTFYFDNTDAITNLRPGLAASSFLTEAYGTDGQDLFTKLATNTNAGVSEDANPTASADELEDQLSKALDQLEQAKSDLDDLQAQIDELEGANQELQDAYDAIQSQIDAINAQLSQLDSDLQDALERASNARDNAEDAEEVLESAQQQLTAAETQISDLQKQNEELQKQASQVGSGGSNLKSQTIKTTTYKSFKAKKIKKKKQSFTIAKASGKITVKKGKGSKKLKVAKNGKLTAKKGLKKGTYTVNVTINAAATSTYAAASTSATITVEVK